MGPKYKVGEVVKVFEYYADMIAKDWYYGLIIDVVYHSIGADGIFIYNILPDEGDMKRQGIQTAEEFAIEEVGRT